MANGPDAVATANVQAGNASRINDFTRREKKRENTPRNEKTQRASEANRRRAFKNIQSRAEFAAKHKGYGWVRGHGGYRDRLGFIAYKTDSLGRRRPAAYQTGRRRLDMEEVASAPKPARRKSVATPSKKELASRIAQVRSEKIARGEQPKSRLSIFK